MEEVISLAALLKQRNAIDEQIARLTGRPSSIGHIGEFIAAKIFGIELAQSAANKGHDGHFLKGPLVGQTVNIKFHAKRSNMLNLPQIAEPTMAELPNYYLVLTGPRSSAGTSRGTHRPLVIEKVFLFEAIKLIQALNLRAMDKHEREARLGIATPVSKQLWHEAEIYPSQRNGVLSLTPDQQDLLSRFS